MFFSSFFFVVGYYPLIWRSLDDEVFFFQNLLIRGLTPLLDILVMRPHTDYLNGVFFFKYLIYKPMFVVNPARICPF
jgi:hypothetical protein